MTPQQFFREVEEEFNQKFPLPEHERMSKCDCRSEEEHDMHYRWFAEPEEVLAFLRSQFSRLLEEVEKGMPGEEIANLKRQEDYVRGFNFCRLSMLTTLKEWKEGVGVGGEEGHEEVKIR